MADEQQPVKRGAAMSDPRFKCTCVASGQPIADIHEDWCASVKNVARPDKSLSVVRQNLMKEPGYSPYCGGHRPAWQAPRTFFDGQQFACRCGWRSSFEPEFIAQYKAKWGKP